MGMLASLMDVSHQEITDLKIILEKLNSVLPDVQTILNKVDFRPPRPHGLPTLQVPDPKWYFAQNFPVDGRNFAIFESGLGFTLDYAEDVAVIRFHWLWKNFCTHQEMHDAFRDCAKVIAASLGSTVVVYISDDSEKASRCLNFIYDSSVSRLEISKILKILQRSAGSANSDNVSSNTYNDTQVLEGYFMDVLA